MVNIYAPSIGAPQCIRQMLTTMKGEIDSNTIIVGGFNTPLTPLDRSSKQKINKETQGRIHLLLKCTWNILQDRSHLGSQMKPQKI